MVRLGRRGWLLAAAVSACVPSAPSPRSTFVHDVPACLPPAYAELGPTYARQLLGHRSVVRELRKGAPLDANGCLALCETVAGICELRQQCCALVPEFPEVCEYAEVCAAPDCDDLAPECERCVAAVVR